MLTPLANIAWTLWNLPAWRRYRRALDDPKGVQERLLLSYVRRNADTAFGRLHLFDRIRSVEEYQARVPLRSYEDYEPSIRRIAEGEPRLLTAEPVRRLAVTSGSTSGAKLIPYTATLQAEYARAVGPWMVDLFGTCPQLAAGRAYWSITPRVAPPPVPGARIPIGFEEDSRYLGGVAHRLIDAVMAAPRSVRELTDHDTHRYVTLLFLLLARDLRLISVWHPSYLVLLLEAMRRNWESLVDDIARGRLTTPAPVDAATAEAVRRRLRARPRRAEELRAAGPEDLRRIWPGLRLVSCWGDAAAGGALDDLRRALPGVAIQPKGLLATEAIVTLPFGSTPPSPDQGSLATHSASTGSRRLTSAGALADPRPRPLAICSHFFEFVDEHGRARLAHEIEPGSTCEVVVTTGGGLYRYRTDDRVRVDGFVGRTPSLSFVGRTAQVCDLVGEKLHESFVAGALARLFGSGGLPRFSMLAPERADGRPSYTLFVEAETDLPEGLAGRLEEALRQNPHYALAVDLGQLGPSRVVRIRHGFERYSRRALARGRRLGDLKPAVLDTDSGWAAVFEDAHG